MACDWAIDEFEAQMRNDLRRWNARGIETVPAPQIVVDDKVATWKRWKIYTDINAYTFSARHGPGEHTYLGCTSCCRKPRAGETWHRGSDLADGPLAPETWHRILADIVSYEMVKIHEVAAPAVDVPAVEFAGDTATGGLNA